MLNLEFTGAVELRYVAGRLRQAAVKDLRRELAKAQRQTYRPLEREIKAQALMQLPHRGGYAQAMARSVKVSVRQNLERRELVAVVYARFGRRARDVRSINAGRLRHPVYTPRRWVAQQVPPGFVDKPARRLGDRLVRESLDALERVAREIVR